MEHGLLTQMHARLDNYLSQGKLDGRFVVVFGSNEPAERIIEYLNQKEIAVDGIVDNNRKKDGTALYHIPVTLPDKLLQPMRENAVVLIASKYYPEMVVQLSNMGYKEGEHILKAVEYSSHSVVSLEEEEFEKRCSMVRTGEQVFQKIMAAGGDVQKVFLCPLKVLGDAYVGMVCLREYLEKNRISHFTIVLVNRACAKVAYLFGFEEQVYAVSEEEMRALMQYGVFTGMADGRMLVLNHRQPYTCRLGEIGNYRGVNFMDHYRYGLLGLPEPTRPETPSVHRWDEQSREYVEKIFAEHQLKRGRTAILFPHAKTAARASEEFWSLLAKELQQQGYVVCTNSAGPGEPAVEGTMPLFFDVRYALETVEAAGLVIGLRSGLCDVISTAKAKKIIIYPDRYYGPDSFLHFFSLNRMELCDDAVELVWRDDDAEVMVKKVMEEVDCGKE